MSAAASPPRVSDRVHERLRRDILEGRLAPEQAVASERALAEELGVNRHAVREALKRLEQAGLVRISQGGATRVLDWRETAGLEVLLDLVGRPAGGAPPADLARSILEMRASIGVDAARRSARRAGAPARAEILRRAEQTARAIGAGGAEVDEDYAALWREIVVASGNVAYRLALTSLLSAIAAYTEIAEALRPDDPAGVRALGAAVAGGDVEAAGAAARGLLERDARLFGDAEAENDAQR
jgi:GntR family transcriptional regulator, transcriptional repressor for pyruvate dehydrogenase complex